MLKLVQKWPMVGCYFILWYILLLAHEKNKEAAKQAVIITDYL